MYIHTYIFLGDDDDAALVEAPALADRPNKQIIVLI